MLFRHAAGVAGERAIRTDNAMTRYDDANRVSSGGSAHCARTARTASAPRKFSIGDGLAEAHAGDRLPHRVLERCAVRRHLDGKVRARATEIFRELALDLAQQRMPRITDPVALNARLIFLPNEIDTYQCLVIGNQQHPPAGAFIEVVIGHGHYFPSAFQRCITAYARHGRQA